MRPKKVAESATFTSTPSSAQLLTKRAHVRSSGSLSQEERAQLRKLESVLKRNEGKASLASAMALHQINVNRLFRGHGNSMKQYGAKWGFSPAYTSRLVRSGEIYARLLPFCRREGLRSPTSAWQLRPLIGTNPSGLEAAWRNAVTQAAGKKVTAATVERCLMHVAGKVKHLAMICVIVRLDLATIPGLAQKLRKTAKHQNLSLEDSILRTLSASVGLCPATRRRQAPNSLSNEELLPALFGPTYYPLPLIIEHNIQG